ncbi:glycosyltransferase [Candidatus Pacearchaeota archaeon]|jgi:GT2 family glycosyltransferase|nr:glycosyltransferase [Candidatus Pacearchaeota archaeon]
MIDIVIPVHNAVDSFKTMMTSLKDFTPRCEYRLIIVDDFSDAPTKAFIDTLMPDVHIITGQQLWFTRALNRGLDETIHPFIAALNTDIVLCPGWVEKLLSYLEDQRVMLAGSDHFPPQKGITYPVRPHYLTGHCWMIRRWFMEQHGTLDEQYTHIDSDRMFSYRVNDLGYKVVRDVELPVLHGQGPSWGRIVGNIPNSGLPSPNNRKLKPIEVVT